ncbi:hypothetical protein Tco_0272548 [Tanacetum coccineum]
MLTQQDIYAAGAENRSSMLNKDNYIPWSSRLLRNAKIKPIEKLLVNLFLRVYTNTKSLKSPVLRRLGSIFTSVYAVKLKRIVSLLKGLPGEKKIALCQKDKAISLGNVTSKVGIEVHQLSLKELIPAAVEVPQTLKYQGCQRLMPPPVLEVEIFTNWKKSSVKEASRTMDDDERKAKSTWDDLILYHEGPSDVKESRVMDLKLCYNTFKFKESESLTQTFTKYKALMNELDFQDSPDDEEDTRSSQEYMNDLEEEYQVRALLSKSKIFFKKVPSYQSPFQPKHLHSSEHKPELRHTKDFEAKYNKVKAKLALLSSSASSPKSSSGKNKGLIAETYEWDEEEVSSDENEEIEVKALMKLANEKRVSVSKESASNGEWVKISIQKVHTLLEMEDNDDRKSFLDYLCIDLSYVEEQRNNLLSKHKNMVQELNTCKEHLLILKQAKLDLLNMFNQCINEQIPTQKKKNLGIDQLTKDTSSSGPKDPVFVKSLADNSKASITGSNTPKLSEAEDSTLSNHDTGKTIKSILKSKSTFKAKTLKGIIINEPSLAPARGNKSSLASKLFSPFHVIKQSERGISINQEKYVKDLLKKYDINGSSVKTQIVPPNKLGPYLNGKAVNETQYRANPKESHLMAVKRIFRYLKGTPSLGLRYPKCSSFDQKGYSDSDYAGCNMDKKSTSGTCQLLEGKLVCWSAKKQQYVAMSSTEANNVAYNTLCFQVIDDVDKSTMYLFVLYAFALNH